MLNITNKGKNWTTNFGTHLMRNYQIYFTKITHKNNYKICKKLNYLIFHEKIVKNIKLIAAHLGIQSHETLSR